MGTRGETRLKHFFDMVRTIGSRIDKEFSFYPETAVYTTEVNFPCITYKILKRTPYQGFKPRVKDIYVKDKDTSLVEYSQLFQCIISFGIWGQSYSVVDDKREWFEKLMIRYSDEFKKEGILEIFFSEQEEDKIIEIKDNSFVKQTINYLFRNVRVFRFPVENIKEILTVNEDLSEYEFLKEQFDKIK